MGDAGPAENPHQHWISGRWWSRARLAAGLTMLVLLAPATYAQSSAPKNQASSKAAELKAREDRARASCRANRGVDCDSPAGLKEWLLHERPRAEAVRDGSRIRPAGAR